MAHKKVRTTIAVGGEVGSGTRKLKLLGIDQDNICHLQLTIKKGESVQIQSPRGLDNPWIGDDPGEGQMVTAEHYVPIGHKIRVGRWRQFRIFPDMSVVIVEPK